MSNCSKIKVGADVEAQMDTAFTGTRRKAPASAILLVNIIRWVQGLQNTIRQLICPSARAVDMGFPDCN